MASRETSTTELLKAVTASCGHEARVLRYAFSFLNLAPVCDRCWHERRERIERAEQERVASRDK